MLHIESVELTELMRIIENFFIQSVVHVNELQIYLLFCIINTSKRIHTLHCVKVTIMHVAYGFLLKNDIILFCCPPLLASAAFFVFAAAGAFFSAGRFDAL